MRPLIGVSSGRLLMPSERARSQDVFIACIEAVCRRVEEAGGAACLIPPSEDATCASRVVESVDSLLLSGGGDIDPLLLNEEPHPRAVSVDPYRDRAEIAMVEKALERGIPILGICKGIQILNVAMGGGLVQHIEDNPDRPVAHWQRTLVPALWHTVDVKEGSLLASLIGAGESRVTSYHHQAVGALAPGLMATAHAPDGVIEAIESKDGKPILGVQYHPEWHPDDDGAAAVFRWIVNGQE